MSTSALFEALPAPLEAIVHMREEYRRAMACQIVHDSWHARGFTTSYLLRVAAQVVGYGSTGGAPGDARDTIKEFFLPPRHLGSAADLFRALIAASGARRIEAQTNDALLLLMLLDTAEGVSSPTVLFADGFTTSHAPPAAEFRLLTEGERHRSFEHTHEPVGEYGLVRGDSVIATGGFALHYNVPYADLYMEVVRPLQRQGLGSYLVQELKRVCHEQGYSPSARCASDNVASRRTLQRAGMLPCARIVHGTIRH